MTYTAISQATASDCFSSYEFASQEERSNGEWVYGIDPESWANLEAHLRSIGKEPKFFMKTAGKVAIALHKYRVGV